MPTKKSVKTASKQNRQDYPTVSVRIDRMVDRKDSKVKAYASANIGGAFAIHGICVVDSQKGLFVQMPQRSYEKDGATKYEDIFHPITADARTELNGAVLSAYEQRLHMEEDESQEVTEPDEDEAPAFGQSM
jgi:stage V sporulation protein G